MCAGVVSCFGASLGNPNVAMKSEKAPQLPLFIAQTECGFYPVVCHHCDDAPCVEACISSALRRSEGIVVHGVLSD